jgi:hypothetical protein
MMFVNSDLNALLNLFNANGVRYLIIGGYAVVQYAESLSEPPRQPKKKPTRQRKKQ